MKTSRSLALASMLTAVACGGSGDAAKPVAVEPAPPSAPADPVAPPLDHGAPSTTYPAFTLDAPQLLNKGGKILTNPVAVTLAWNDSPNAGVFENLVDTIGASAYWRDVVGEYGVGPLTSGAANHVRLTAPLVLSTDPNADPVQPVIDLLIAGLGDLATSHWPAPTDQSIYIFYFSGPTAQTLCEQGMGGMHESVTVGGKEVAFALTMECEGDPQFTGLENATISTSHELAEASVDPYPDASPAWQGVDSGHLAWELFQQGQDENADMCEFYDDSYGPHAAPEISLFVQRSWSNKSIAAGHSPCVPAPKDPYFNVAALDVKDDLVADFGDFEMPLDPKSKGVHIGVGETRTIPIGFYTDGPTDAFTLQAFELDPFSNEDPMAPGGPTNKTLELALDKSTGQNGEKAYLSVKVLKTSSTGTQIVLLQSTLGNATHFMPILVGGNPADPAQRLDQDGIPKGSGGAKHARALKRASHVRR